MGENEGEERTGEGKRRRRRGGKRRKEKEERRTRIARRQV
jgi:hypothetical protein